MWVVMFVMSFRMGYVGYVEWPLVSRVRQGKTNVVRRRVFIRLALVAGDKIVDPCG